MLLFIIFVLFSSTSASKCESAGWSDDDRWTILTTHNNLRSKLALGEYTAKGVKMPAAKDMRKMIYDCQLEASAQKWADTCPTGHHAGSSENMYWSFSVDKMNIGEGATKAVKSWEKEFQDHGFRSHRFSSSDSNIKQATQMAWARTWKVGCGVKQCRSNTFGFSNVIVVVCQYSPGGNSYNHKVYEDGETCSDCPLGTRCERSTGLCSREEDKETDSREEIDNQQDERARQEEDRAERAREERRRQEERAREEERARQEEEDRQQRAREEERRRQEERARQEQEDERARQERAREVRRRQEERTREEEEAGGERTRQEVEDWLRRTGEERAWQEERARLEERRRQEERQREEEERRRQEEEDCGCPEDEIPTPPRVEEIPKTPSTFENDSSNRVDKWVKKQDQFHRRFQEKFDRMVQEFNRAQRYQY